MSNIIVVFPKRENAVNIRNSLVRAGIEVSAVCLTGAKVLQYADNWNDGIVVCGYRFQDMQYTDLRESLPDTFDMLLVASADKWMDGLPDGVVGLPLPIKVYDLVNTVEMIEQEEKRAQRNDTKERRFSEKDNRSGESASDRTK